MVLLQVVDRVTRAMTATIGDTYSRPNTTLFVIFLFLGATVRRFLWLICQNLYNLTLVRL